MLENFHKETFEEQLNTPFQVIQEDATSLTLQLTEVGGKGVHGKQEQFSLIFLGPLETPLGQGMQSMEHTHLGKFDLFLVPVGRTDEGFEYEAIFNRLLDKVAL